MTKLNDNTTVHFEGSNIIIKQEVEQEIESVELEPELFDALMAYIVLETQSPWLIKTLAALKAKLDLDL